MIAPGGEPWRTFLQRLVAVVVALGLVVAGGTVAFIATDGWSVGDALWMSIITVTAVGYEEVRPLTRGTQVVATCLLAGGITLMGVWFAALTSAIVEMDLAHVFKFRRNMRKIEKLDGHVVVCGIGRTGRQIVSELEGAGVPYVAIDKDEERAEVLQKTHEQALVLVADATRDETLVDARIERARGLVACLSQDTDNLFVCLSARDRKSDLTIVARAYDEQTMQKLRVAGADHVVSPNVTGGVRMASVLLRPKVVSFLDVVAGSEGLALRLEQVDIPGASPLAGHSLAEARIPQRTGLIVIAIRSADEEPAEGWRYNPGPDESLREGDALIVLGKPAQIDKLASLVTG